MRAIDAHIHVYGDHADCRAALERLNFKMLNVCVAHRPDEVWREQAEVFRSLTDGNPERFAWCTAFDIPDFEDSGWADRVVEAVKQDLEAGAIACKAWKNIGMDIQKPSGAFLMIDDAIFDPLFAYLAEVGVPLMAHIGEPLACWQPIEEGKPHASYYKNNPQWHMYNRPEYPSHREIIDARDRMLERHPKLRVIGAHLGSLEYDVAEVAARLDRYPNFAVDTSARVGDLAYQDSGKVREFLVAYQDRVLFGTDIVQRQPYSGMSDADRQKAVKRLEDQYAMERAYYGSTGAVTVRGKETEGLNLSDDVLEKLYFRNAEAWYPGVA